MAEDITSLVLKVESNQVGKASKELDKLSHSGKKTEKATDSLAMGFKRLIGPLLATVSAVQGLKKLVSITREFDILNAQLITATGSADNAAIAFGAIQDFATNTPFQLGEVTEAFVQLVNRGLDPSEQSLTNIGNFASAFGRNILDATRAIGQATTGEFESLKQFGIVARKNGEEVNFTFRGVTETVRFNAQEIQGYMNDLAENNFAGAMGERMNTLDGAMSNLQDAWDKLFLTISQDSSIGAAIENSVRLAITAIESLEGALENSKVSAFFDAVALALHAMNQEANRVDLVGLVDDITEAGVKMQKFGPNYYEPVLDGLLEKYEATVDGLNRAGLEDQLNLLTAAALQQKSALSELYEAQRDAIGTFSDKKATENLETAKKRLEVLNTTIEGLRGTLKELNQEAADTGATDRLAGFGVGGEPTDPNALSDQEADRLRDRYDRLVESLWTEEEAIEESYQRRLDLAKEYAEFTGESVAEIETRIEKQKQEQIKALNQQRWNTALSSFDDFQNNILVLARTGSKELAGVYKAAAIANTIIKTYESATSAYSAMAGIPYVGPALGVAAAAAAVAAGLANVQAIASTPVGQYTDGGIIPGTSFGGDNLTASVNSGEMVLNRDQQNRLFSMANGQSGGKQTIINVQNFGNSEVEVKERDSGDARIIDIAVGRAKTETKREIASDIRTGSGDVSRAMESSFNLKRGTA